MRDAASPSPLMPAAPKAETSDWALLGLLALLWGSSFGLLKVAGETIPPMTAIFGRVFPAGLLLWAVAAARGRSLPGWRRAEDRRLWAIFTLMGVIGNAAPFALILSAERTVSSGTAGILIAFMPLATLLLAGLTLRDERLTSARLGGFALGFAGVATLIGPAAFANLGGRESLAQGAVLLAALLYAANAVFTRTVDIGDRWTAAAGINLSGGLAIGLAALLAERPWTIAPSAQSLLAVVIMALGASALATVLFLKIVKSAGPGFISYVNYLIPLVTAVAGAIFFGERLGPPALLAMALILSGLALSRRKSG